MNFEAKELSKRGLRIVRRNGVVVYYQTDPFTGKNRKITREDFLEAYDTPVGDYECPPNS